MKVRDEDWLEIEGSPSREEAAAIRRALEQMLRVDPWTKVASAWKAAGWAAGARSGILDLRARLGGSAWPLSARLPWTGRRHAGRHGRGDAR